VYTLSVHVHGMVEALRNVSGFLLGHDDSTLLCSVGFYKLHRGSSSSNAPSNNGNWAP
jgi:hypothetical protein